MADDVLVVGFDGSHSSYAALRYAARRATREPARLVVVCVHPTPPRDLKDRAKAALLADYERKAHAALDQLRADPPAELESVAWTAVLEGAPAPARGLLQVSHREQAAAIVVGTHGRGRVSSLLGSVAHDLLREADLPIVAIPPKAVIALGEPPD